MKKQYIASQVFDDSHIFNGYGATREEAVNDCLRQTTPAPPVEVWVEFLPGVCIREENVPKTDPPAGMTLAFIFIRYHSEDSSDDSDAIVVAIKPGSYFMFCTSSEYLVGTEPMVIEVSDADFDHDRPSLEDIPLPEGSLKYDFTGQQWVACETSPN